MSIQWVNDLGAPLAVTAIDLVVETTNPQWNEWAAYGTAGIGWLSAGMGWGGPFLKNMAIAATPWATKKIYNRVRGLGVSSPVRRLSARGISRWPAPTVEVPFGGARLV